MTIENVRVEGDQLLFDVNTPKGTVAPAPNICVSTGILIFGDVCVGSSSTATVTISNTGTAELSVSEISSTDSQFTLSRSNLSLSPGSSAEVTVVFVPNSAGSKADTLTIMSNDPDAGSVSVSVFGTGSELPVADISVSTTSLSFGDVEVGASKTASITISNTGTDGLLVSKISSSDSQFTLEQKITQNPRDRSFLPFSTLIDFPFGWLSPDSSAEVTVVFVPQEGGDQTGFLTISSNDPDRPVVTIEVAGVGLSVGDFDGDGSVGFSDFLMFAQAFGTNDTKFDIDGDGSVGFADFLLFAAEFGK